MVSIILWSNEAIASYGRFVNTRSSKWTLRDADNFKNYTHATLELLKTQPQLGDPTTYKANIRKIQIRTRMMLIYRHVPDSDTIELIQFYNTLQTNDSVV